MRSWLGGMLMVLIVASALPAWAGDFSIEPLTLTRYISTGYGSVLLAGKDAPVAVVLVEVEVLAWQEAADVVVEGQSPGKPTTWLSLNLAGGLGAVKAPEATTQIEFPVGASLGVLNNLIGAFGLYAPSNDEWIAGGKISKEFDFLQ